MSRYIDADKFNKDLAEACVHKAVVSAVLRRQPTADVVEVRHGEWKKAYEKAPRYVCTACNHLFNNKAFKYCPNCGAKMDGERRSNDE